MNLKSNFDKMFLFRFLLKYLFIMTSYHPGQFEEVKHLRTLKCYYISVINYKH